MSAQAGPEADRLPRTPFAPGFDSGGEGQAGAATLAVSVLVGMAITALPGEGDVLLARGIVLCVWAAGAVAVVAPLHPLLDLSRHFPVAYAAAAVAAAVPLAMAGDAPGVAAALVAAVLAASCLAPWWRRRARAPGRAEGERLRVLYANVLTESRSAPALASLVDAADADLVLLIEVDDAWLEQLALHHRGYAYAVAEPRDDHFGLAAYSRAPILRASFVPLVTPDMPALLAAVACGTAELSILLVHTMPPKGPRRAVLREVQLEEAARIARAAPTPFLLVGDLNATPWSSSFLRLVCGAGLADARRGAGLRPTWPARLPWPLRLPIDHMLMRGSVSVRSIAVGPAYGSDHRPLLFDLTVPSGLAAETGNARGAPGRATCAPTDAPRGDFQTD